MRTSVLRLFVKSDNGMMRIKRSPSLKLPAKSMVILLSLWANSRVSLSQGFVENLSLGGNSFAEVEASYNTITVTPYTIVNGQNIGVGHYWFYWQPPNGLRMESVREKLGVVGRYLVLLSNGAIMQFDVTPSGVPGISKVGNLPPGEDFHQIAGDALYAVSFSGRVYVSRNDGVSWLVDTVGLSNAYVQRVDLDTAQYVYAATTKGLFKQHPDSSTWKRVDSLYTLSFNLQKTYPDLFSVFVDRRNFLYANQAYTGTYVSRNNGLTWTFDTAGLGNRPLSDFGEDRFGNVYAITSGSDNRIYRSADSGRSWTRIDGTLAGLKLDPRNLFPFNSIKGDSQIVLSTSYGVFRSFDRGDTWIEPWNKTRFAAYNSLLRAGNRTVISTERGIFYRTAIDSIWTKGFPASGFLGGLILHRDGPGNLYTTGEAPNLYTVSMFYKSTNQGTSWLLDTTGYWRLAGAGGIFYVDEQGNQHYSVPTSFGVRKYSKLPASAWVLDTVGLKSTSSQDIAKAMHSDRAGFLYLAGKFNGGNMWRRSISGGQWVLDTAGLGTRVPEFLTVDRNGNPLAIIAVEYPKHAIYLRSSGVWTRLSHPAAGPSVSRISVDSTNAIWASLYDDPFNDFGRFEVDNRGVYVTTNTGATWTKVGVDSTVILGLVSYGDTTFALTQDRGLFAMKSTGVLSVVQDEVTHIPVNFSLLQNFPNPFNPRTTIRYQVPSTVRVSLRVYNLLGQEVAKLVDEEKTGGEHEVSLDASGLSSGIYFYRIVAASFTQTRKLVLLK